MNLLNMKFLDSNVLAYAFYSSEYTEECQEVIKQGGVTDTLNLIEAFHIIEKETGSKELAKKSIRGLMKSDITIVDIDVNLIFEALKKIEESTLSIFDMIHYTCALQNNCESIVSYDGDFDRGEIPRKKPNEVIS